jgi:hypothetical protein
VVSRAGHGVFLDNPEGFAEAVARFLAESWTVGDLPLEEASDE